ncbi:MAG: hypothetical protein H0W86_12520, partial [Armatimonadetes bacterium]|nr:hypothetical protein [Armatimonadota bacterium]
MASDADHRPLSLVFDRFGALKLFLKSIEAFASDTLLKDLWEVRLLYDGNVSGSPIENRSLWSAIRPIVEKYRLLMPDDLGFRFYLADDETERREASEAVTSIDVAAF